MVEYQLFRKEIHHEPATMTGGGSDDSLKSRKPLLASSWLEEETNYNNTKSSNKELARISEVATLPSIIPSNLDVASKGEYRSPIFKKIPRIFGASGGFPEEDREESRNQQMVTVEEAAKILGVTEQQVYRLVREGRVEAKKRITIISLRSLLEYSESRWKRE